MKVGDRLYVVYEGMFDDALTIETAEIVSIGPKVAKIRNPGGRSTGLAFGCRTQISRERLAQYGTSPRDAWQKYTRQVKREIAETEAKLVELRQRLDQAIVKGAE